MTTHRSYGPMLPTQLAALHLWGGPMVPQPSVTFVSLEGCFTFLHWNAQWCSQKLSHRFLLVVTLSAIVLTDRSIYEQKTCRSFLNFCRCGKLLTEAVPQNEGAGSCLSVPTNQIPNCCSKHTFSEGEGERGGGRIEGRLQMQIVDRKVDLS